MVSDTQKMSFEQKDIKRVAAEIKGEYVAARRYAFAVTDALGYPYTIGDDDEGIIAVKKLVRWLGVSAGWSFRAVGIAKHQPERAPELYEELEALLKEVTKQQKKLRSYLRMKLAEDGFPVVIHKNDSYIPKPKSNRRPGDPPKLPKGK